MTDETERTAPPEGEDLPGGESPPAEVDDLAVSDAEDEAEDGRRPRTLLREVVEFVLTLGLAFLLATAFRTYLFEPFIINQSSMVPTVMPGEFLAVNKYVYRTEQPRPGDIVVLDDPSGLTPALLKRVIAVGGQTIELRDGRVYVDGARLDEPYVHGAMTYAQGQPPVVLVPAGYVWVMGDNRMLSKDSRQFGPQPIGTVRGKVVFRYWPLARWGPL